MWKTVKEFNFVLLTLKNQANLNIVKCVFYQPNLLITKFLHYFQIV